MIRRRVLVGVSSVLLLALAAGCTTDDAGDDAATASPAPVATTEQADVASAPESFEDLVAAAQAEGEVTVYWHSSRIGTAGEEFERLYGIVVNGTKLSDSEQTERVTREVDAGNVQVDVIGYDDGALLESQLQPQGYVENYVPAEIADLLPPDSLDPLVYLWQPIIWGYNTETYGDTCPVTNIWELTEEEWTDNLAILDPQLRSVMIQWFTAIVSQPEMMEQAYASQYGEALQTDAENAGWEFVRRFAQNNPLLFSEDVELAEAVGASGQSDPPMGMYYLGRHREMEEKGLNLRVCHEMEPFVGFDAPTFVQIVDGAPNPNAARLFIHFLFTEEGVSPWVMDAVGGYSPHPELLAGEGNPFPTRADWEGSLLVADNLAINENRESLLEFWLLNR